ncbi:MAG: hypothetical protein CMN75_01270 [Spirochaeta sp.]|nr:hypothetical protein [Spirochaeta sp.]RPG03081.1 MAG: DUF2256 and DUF3253 domain-containing protein [Proteobacteria bacterium TMED72]
MIRESDDKVCLSCGRTMTWRKSWGRNWDQVKYCSAACRRRKIRKIDQALENKILELLESEPRGGSVCPSEAARELDPRGWKSLLEPARCAARRLESKGKIHMKQKGQNINPSTAKGAIRLFKVPRRPC